MFFIVLKKLLNNKWLIACLLAGSILVVAMVGSIPMYTNGILQRMLTRDLQGIQSSTGVYPGDYTFRLETFGNAERGKRISTYQFFDQKFSEGLVENMGVPLAAASKELRVERITIAPREQREEQPRTRSVSISAISGWQEHVELKAGRMPAATAVDGVYEVLIPESMQTRLDVRLDEVYTITQTFDKEAEPIYVMPVGLYTARGGADAWWPDAISSYDTRMLMDYDLMQSEFMGLNDLLTNVTWHYALDYNAIKTSQMQGIQTAVTANNQWFTYYAGATVECPMLDVLSQYGVREGQLRVTLWVLQVPILMMLAFYIFMVSQMIVENDRGEIAVLQSRGASPRQLFKLYLLQSLLLVGTAVVIGPFLALGMCKVLGASNGFLEFVGRASLPVAISWPVVGYTLLAGVFAMVMMLLPAMKAARTSIVEFKQKKARRWNAPLWQKLFLDVILIAVSLYGLYSYNVKQGAMTEAVTSTAAVDPMLFFLSTLFILGVGLLFLRIHPWIVRGIFFLGRKKWNPVLYSSFLQVGRSDGREQFLMLFLVLSLAIGVFSANAARTINQNMEERIRYSIGADLTMQQHWPSFAVGGSSSGSGATDASSASASSSENTNKMYQEPSYNVISQVAGTTASAKVLMPDGVMANSDTAKNQPAVLMAVEPEPFSRVVWSNSTILPYHINEYLKLLQDAPGAAIISRGMAESMGLSPGDAFQYIWNGQDLVNGTVYAVVEYWPGINPLEEGKSNFIIANYQDVSNQVSRIDPYQVWFARDPDVATSTVYQDIQDKGLQLEWMHDARQELVEAKNDPMLQGTNGAMTMGFIVTMLISFIGFIIYWVLSIRSRELQFGILRAMGMTKREVLGMLACEQVMISLLAILAGIIIGGAASDLFVPLLQMVYGAADMVPPFQVVKIRRDYYKIYSFVLIMLAAGFAILGRLISRIKIAQAIKLGED